MSNNVRPNHDQPEEEIGNLEILGMTLQEVEELVTNLGQPRYRAQQMMKWVYKQGIDDFEGMSNLPFAFQRQLLEIGLVTSVLTEDAAQQAPDGTKKYLFRLQDGLNVESVFIPEERRRTVCFSTQAGCAVGCVFCATGQKGFHRNLTTAEIVDQVRSIGIEQKTRITHAVAMGQGEPLVNYVATLKAIKLLNAEYGLGIAARHLTLSTSGVVPAIYRLAEEEIQLNLAISLHATRDQLRSKLIPLNRTYPLSVLMQAGRSYAESTKRRVTLEYIMINGVNDGEEDLNGLLTITAGWLCHVNLIPYNSIPGARYRPSAATTIRRFFKTLQRHNVAVSIRQERGAEVEAACGQLRQRLNQKEKQ